MTFDWLHHLVIIPVVLPLLASATMLLIDEQRRKLKNFISLFTIAIILSTSFILSGGGYGDAVFYALGDWKSPFGIVLVADQLSSTMVLLTSLLAMGALLFSLARWDRAGPRFQPLFMLQIMGINGAFLTGDLFNLFVFFEVLLAASYALVLHGGGSARIKAGLHYIAVNLVASSLFLVGVSMIYGMTGTLNMADLSFRAAGLEGTDRALFDLGVSILGVAFLIKAAMWPLGFWLPAAYSAASAPAAAIFAIMSKVGIYALLRIFILVPGEGGSFSTPFFEKWLFIGGVATIVYGSIVVLSSRTLSRVASACIFISSGTLLCAIGANNPAVLASGLFYLASSVLTVGAFFLLIELLNRARGTNAPVLGEPVFSDEYRDPYEDGMPDDTQGNVVIPAALALMSGGFFICALLLIGLPPMSGFIGKFAIMSSILNADGADQQAWVLIGVLTVSSLMTMIAMVRIGIEVLWAPSETPPPKVAPVEFVSIAGLIGVCILLAIFSGPAMRYMEQTATWLYSSGYTDIVLQHGDVQPSEKGDARGKDRL